MMFNIDEALPKYGQAYSFIFWLQAVDDCWNNV